MKNLLLGMMIALCTLAMVDDASARPLGGGRTIGRQSPAVARQAPTPAPAPAAATPRPATPTPAPAPAAPKPSMWKGVLGGALLGLGLGALFSHMGIGGAMASMLSSLLMIALLVLAGLFVYRMFKRKGTPSSAPFSGFNQQPQPAGGAPEIGSRIEPAAYQPPQPAPFGVPADFDQAAFLRQAKASFIRMQAAWDKADTNDLKEFTTPEVFAELKMQIQERGQSADFTDVVSIDGELLGIETGDHDDLASVKFVGMIKSSPTAAAEPFAEVWNMSKPHNGSTGWVLAGIQQLS
ncbi:MAG: Tim44-like domain-containing protein [Pseudomonadota bacterium]